MSVLAVVPVMLHSLGAPLGEPFADDFDYLHRTLFTGFGSFFDGYGSALYWRPLGRQVYYSALSGLILSHPAVVVGLHVALLALAAALLYRAFRPSWPGPAAAAIATFPLGMESARMLIAWPSHFMDLGALLFAALAIHEASRRRLATTMSAMLASLLCKEVGVATALLLPWVPTARPEATSARWRWTIACASLVAFWAIAYAIACSRGGMVLPQSLDPGGRDVPIAARFVWAVVHSVRAAFSLAAAPGPWDSIILAGAGALLAYTLLISLRRGRIPSLVLVIAWGGAWLLAASATLTQVYPAWAPYRANYGTIGLGAILVILCHSAHPKALAALVALRLIAFALSPGPPAKVTGAAAERGAAFDFERLVRLERLVRETRVALTQRYPSLPRGARVGWHYMPRITEYAFAGDKAIQVWYRDTTLRWVPSAEVLQERERLLTTIVEFEPESSPHIALVEAAATKRLLHGMRLVRRMEFDSALVVLAEADSIQRDRRAGVFLGSVGGQRARALLGLSRYEEAELAARAGAAQWRENVFAQYVLACVHYVRGDHAAATMHADSVLRFRPEDAEALRLKTLIRDARARIR